MSRSLSFSCHRVNEPAATDPLEQRTWAAFRVLANGRCVTQFWDRTTKAEAETINVPMFPLARWIIGNWWPLFFESCKSELPPPEGGHWSRKDFAWIHRHCLRSAESGLFLPYLHLYNNGPSVTLAWFEDDAQAYPSMPGYFVNTGLTQLDRQEAMDGAGECISKVLEWCRGLDDPRAEQLRTEWDAITNGHPDEMAFCRAAGRMGLDPYTVAEWQSGLADLLVQDIGPRIEEVIAEDLLEVVEPSAAWSAAMADPGTFWFAS